MTEQQVPAMTTNELAAATGITYRMLDYWARQQWLHPEGTGGTGNNRTWPAEEVAVARRMAELVTAGLTPAGAAEVARNGWPGGAAPVSSWHPSMTAGDWQARALCAETDPEAFFPEQGSAVRPAQAVCRACEVREQCLDYAIATDQRWGIWGGLGTRQRDKEARKRARSTA